MRCSQAETPKGWNNLWIVGGWHDETPHAQKLCQVLCYTRNRSGRIGDCDADRATEFDAILAFVEFQEDGKRVRCTADFAQAFGDRDGGWFSESGCDR